MNTQINRMLFKQTLFFIVLTFAFLPAFGSPVEWRGRYTDEWYQEGSKRFLPSPVERREGYSDEWYQRGSKRFLPFLNHWNTFVWMLDFGQPFDSESAWLLYEQSQNIRHLKPERDLLCLCFSPRWRRVETVILKEPEIESWQIRRY